MNVSIWQSYISCFDEIRNYKRNTYTTNFLATLKIISFFTGIIPLAIYGVSYLLGRVSKKQELSELDQRVDNQSRKQFPKSDLPIAHKLSLKELGLTEADLPYPYKMLQLGQHRIYILSENHEDPKCDALRTRMVLHECRKNIIVFKEGLLNRPYAEQILKTAMNLPSQAYLFGIEQPHSYWLEGTIMTIFFNYQATFRGDKRFKDHFHSNRSNLIHSLQKIPEGRSIWKKVLKDWEKRKQTSPIYENIYLDAQRIDQIMNKGNRAENIIIDEIDKVLSEVNWSAVEGFASFLKDICELLIAEAQLGEQEKSVIKAAIRSDSSLQDCLKALTLMTQKRDFHFANSILQQLPKIPNDKPLVAIVGSEHLEGTFSYLQAFYQ